MRTDGRTYGQTDMTKLTVAFRNFANAPKTRDVFFVFMVFIPSKFEQQISQLIDGVLSYHSLSNYMV